MERTKIKLRPGRALIRAPSLYKVHLMRHEIKLPKNWPKEYQWFMAVRQSKHQVEVYACRNLLAYRRKLLMDGKEPGDFFLYGELDEDNNRIKRINRTFGKQ